jgi:leader peptidase (prepilin peptidase)/N-methyltransferase
VDWIWPLLLAPFAGSFLGVMIRRLPHGRLLDPPRSACERCGAVIAVPDLVPLVSYWRLGGRCRACGGAIAAQHWQVELAALAVTATAVMADAEPLWPVCVCGWALLALAWIDWDCMLLPDVLTLPLVVGGLLATWWWEPEMATDHALAAAAGYLGLMLLAVTYRRVRGRDGIGEGDAKLLAALGAWVGLEGLPSTVVGAAVIGLAAALVMVMRGRTVRATTPLPFGCCLALAGWIVLLVES